ncbi:MAG: hypothetical protein ACRD2F_06255, partial [Terriglobales bacterium]
PSSVAYAATNSRMYSVVTVATFPQPLVLKSPAHGPRSGQPVVMRFPGGTALVNGVCTQARVRATAVRVGVAYLVFATPMAGPGSGLLGTAYPINPKSSEVMAAGGGSAPLPRGSRLSDALAAIHAEVTRERAAAGKGAQQ